MYMYVAATPLILAIGAFHTLLWFPQASPSPERGFSPETVSRDRSYGEVVK
jgi:hypothetical protein